MGGKRDVEADIRQMLARDAQICLEHLRRRDSMSVDTSINYLITRAYSSPRRLLEAHVSLGEEDQGARALLLRAARRAADPIPPGPPKPFAPPDAPRPTREDGLA